MKGKLAIDSKVYSVEISHRPSLLMQENKREDGNFEIKSFVWDSIEVKGDNLDLWEGEKDVKIILGLDSTKENWGLSNCSCKKDGDKILLSYKNVTFNLDKK